DLGEDRLGDLEGLAAGGRRGLDRPAEQAMLRAWAVEQDPGRMALLDALGDVLQALGYKEVRLVARLAQVQGADGLNRRVGQRGDAAAHEAHRAKKLMPIWRSPASSTSASSPHSMVPARSFRVSASRPESAAPEIRSA